MQIFHRHVFWQKITETHQSSIGKLCISYLWWKLCKLLLKSWYKSTSAKMEKTDTKTIRATAGMSASYSGRDAPYVFTLKKNSLLCSLIKTALLSFWRQGWLRKWAAVKLLQLYCYVLQKLNIFSKVSGFIFRINTESCHIQSIF